MSFTTTTTDSVRPIAWRDDALVLLDQRALPMAEQDVVCRTAGEAAAAYGVMIQHRAGGFDGDDPAGLNE